MIFLIIKININTMNIEHTTIQLFLYININYFIVIYMQYYKKNLVPIVPTVKYLNIW